MSWNKWILAQNLFFGVCTTTVAGSVMVLLLLLLERMPKYRYSRLKLAWMKTAQILYLFPVMAFAVILTRISISFQWGIAWYSDFWMASTMPMQSVYGRLMIIWFTGLLFGVIFRIRQYWKLHKILMGNIPVENELCQKVIEEYQAKYKLKKVTFYQNDLLNNPICVGTLRPKVVLPLKDYTEKELHMVLRHELHHIKSQDLLWKKSGLLVTFVHWGNPLTYLLLKRLILQEEIECDIKTCENNQYFTMKEYGGYLAGLEENKEDMIFSSALCRPKKDLFRRIEGMVRGKSYVKKMAVTSSLVLAALAMIPSYAMAEGTARMNEKWLAQTEVEMEVEPIDYAALEMTGTVGDEPNVEEIDLTLEQEVMPFSTTITLDRTINANTRVLYHWKSMQAGEQINIAAQCKDSGIVYRIGIRDSAGNLTYRQGSGSMTHTFTVPSNGSYTAYVENRSNKSMNIKGAAVYLD